VQSRSSVLAAALRASGAAAQDQAVAASSDPPGANPPACTFVAAVLDGTTLVTGWVGDSRAYWLPDAGVPVQLSTDDSWAAEAMALGFSREEAEHAPQAHSITRWLGRDAPDAVPRTAARRLEEPGWLMLCSDGLWNYASEAADLRDLVAARIVVTGPEPLAVAEALVVWANEQGGHDNITVALARIGQQGSDLPATADAAGAVMAGN
jgi:serine/threonine protein phosphatase PrpC